MQQMKAQVSFASSNQPEFFIQQMSSAHEPEIEEYNKRVDQAQGN